MKNTYHNSFVSFFLKEIYNVLCFFSFNCTFSLEKNSPHLCFLYCTSLPSSSLNEHRLPLEMLGNACRPFSSSLLP